jgi:hypothetical protein
LREITRREEKKIILREITRSEEIKIYFDLVMGVGGVVVLGDIITFRKIFM